MTRRFRAPITAFIVLLVAGPAWAQSAPARESAPGQALAPLVERDGWVVKRTPLSFPALVQKLDAAVKANGMGLVTFASASAGAKAQGFDIPGNRIVGVFRNDFARRMLAASIPAGIEAPIRFYVTENADRTATLSWRAPSAVFAPYMAAGGEALKTLADELDQIFARIAGDATKT